MKITALILASAITTAPPSLKTPAEDADAMLVPEGSSFTCTSPTGCVVTTPELLQAALRNVHEQGRRVCLRSL